MKDSLKIFFYIGNLSGGGAQRAVSNLASSFVTCGHDVSIVTSYKTQNEFATLSSIRKIVLRSEKRESSFLLRNIKETSRLRRLLKVDKPYVLISFMGETNFRAIVASAFLKVKTIISVRNDPHKEYPSKIGWFLAGFLFKKADGAVFQTPDAMATFCKKIQDKAIIIPNMINPIFYLTPQDAVKDCIVSVGRLTSQKNHKVLIEAFAELKDEIKEDLYIYGKGELHYDLEHLIFEKNLNNRVFLCGNVNNIEKKLAGAKLFVLSSDYEGMPNALMEAMAMGLPCVSTDCPCGGPRMLIKNGVSGLLVPVDDKVSMKSAIKRVLKDMDFACNMGKAAKEESKKYTSECISATWLKYIERILE